MLFRKHKWNRPKRKAEWDAPYCTVCKLEATFYMSKIGPVSSSGEVWGSHVAIRYPRAAFWGCPGTPQPTEAYRI